MTRYKYERGKMYESPLTKLWKEHRARKLREEQRYKIAAARRRNNAGEDAFNKRKQEAEREKR